jgi:hypothetical protein
VHGILDVAVRYVGGIFQHMNLLKNIDVANINFLEILSIILRMLLRLLRLLQLLQLLIMKRQTQMTIYQIVDEVEVEAEVEAEVEVEVEAVVAVPKKITRKERVDIDVRHDVPRNIERDAIEF